MILTRRNYKKLVKIVEALNIIKPYNTTSTITGLNDNELACMDSSIVVGTTNGNAVINKEIINNLANDAFIIDVGKGSFHPNAIKIARNKNINIYRLDISAAFDALIYKLSTTEELFEKKCGRRYIYNENLISGGLLGDFNDIVVDDINKPSRVYGISDGNGDFIRVLTNEQKKEYIY